MSKREKTIIEAELIDETQPAKDPIAELKFRVEGKVLETNFPLVKTQTVGVLTLINYSPSTDEEFAKADGQVAALELIEKTLKERKQDALQKCEALNTALAEIDDLVSQVNDAKNRLARQIKDRKLQKKEDAIKACLDSIDTTRRNYYATGARDAVHGKKGIKGCEIALKAYAELVNSQIRAARSVLVEFEKVYGGDLISDKAELEIRDPAELPQLLADRLEKKKLRDERDKARKEAEEARAKAEAEKRAAAAPTREQEVKTFTTIAGAAGVDPAKPEISAPAPKQTPLPVAPPSQPRSPSPNFTPAERVEWNSIREIMNEFGERIREARGALKKERNVHRAQALADALNQIWKRCPSVVSSSTVTVTIEPNEQGQKATD